jgi:hypothetical protein
MQPEAAGELLCLGCSRRPPDLLQVDHIGVHGAQGSHQAVLPILPAGPNRHQRFHVITRARPAGTSLMGSPFGVISTTVGHYNTHERLVAEPQAAPTWAFRPSWRADEGGLPMGSQSARRTPT